MTRLALIGVVVAVVGCTPSAPASNPPSTAAAPSPVAPPPSTVAPGTAEPAAVPVVGEVDPTLRLQVLLDRAHFSPGAIDGKPGGNTDRALAAYARAKKLAGAGAAAEALAADTSPVLVRYTITASDVVGPFHPIPDDMMEKAKLPALSYSSVEEALGEKFHVTPELLASLNPGAAFTAGQALVVPNVTGPAASGRAARVEVDKSDFSVTALDAQGSVLASYPATMGSERDPLPLGKWTINGVSRDPTFNYNPDLFWDGDESHAKAKIPPGPNNPVGVVWIDLSKPHYGIHGTPEPATIGKTESHGCIRLTNWDAQELAGLVEPGTPAILQE